MARVTGIIKIVKDFGFVPREVLNRAAKLGTEVHKVSLAYAKGLRAPVAEHIRPYFFCFKAWFDANIVEVLAVELELEDKKLDIIGHVDLIARPRGSRRFVIYDLKRVALVDWTVGLQLAAYEYLAEKKYKRKFGGRFALWLTPQATMKAVPFNDPEDVAAFWACHFLYNHSLKPQGVLSHGKK